MASKKFRWWWFYDTYTTNYYIILLIDALDIFYYKGFDISGLFLGVASLDLRLLNALGVSSDLKLLIALGVSSLDLSWLIGLIVLFNSVYESTDNKFNNNFFEKDSNQLYFVFN
jgi:hypothetical protein